MEVGTNNLAVEKIISDIDKDLAGSDKEDDVDHIVVYKTTDSDNGEPIMVMQIPDSDFETDSPDKTTTKENNVKTSQTTVMPVVAGDNCSTIKSREITKNLLQSVNSGSEKESSGKRKAVVEVDADEDCTTSVNRKEKERAESNGVVQKGVDGVTSVGNNLDVVPHVDNPASNPTVTNDIKIPQTSNVSVMVKRLGYFSISNMAAKTTKDQDVEDENIRKVVHFELDQKSSDKKNRSSKSNKSLSQDVTSEKDGNPGQTLAGSKTELCGSEERKKKTRCLICCAFVSAVDYDKHIEEHTLSVIANKSGRRSFSDFSFGMTESNPKSKYNRRKGKSSKSNALTKSKNKLPEHLSLETGDKSRKFFSKRFNKSVTNYKAKTVQSYSPKNAFVCDECGSSFATLGNVTRHKKITHIRKQQDDLIDEENNSTKEKQDEEKRNGGSWCNLCEKLFLRKYNFKVHMMNVHSVDISTEEADQSYTKHKKRKLEQSISGTPAKKGKKKGKWSKQKTQSSHQKKPKLSQQTATSSQQQMPTLLEQTPTQNNTSLNKRSSNRSSLATPICSEPLVILPFLNMSTPVTSTAGSSPSTRCANLTPRNSVLLESSYSRGHIDFSALGKPKEVRRETVRKYRKSGPHGEEEIVETVTEVW